MSGPRNSSSIYETVVLKIGGSVLYRDSFPDPELLSLYASIADEVSTKVRLILVVGGGKLARKLISVARDMSLPKSIQDYIGSSIARLTAFMLAWKIKNAQRRIPNSFEEVLRSDPSKVLVLGGLQPGQSTDAVAALLAETFGASRLIIASDIDGVYDKDPKLHVDAKRLEKTSYRHLFEIVARLEHEPGSYRLIDTIALRIAARSKIPIIFVNGRDRQKIIEAILEGKGGTIVTDEDRGRRNLYRSA